MTLKDELITGIPEIDYQHQRILARFRTIQMRLDTDDLVQIENCLIDLICTLIDYTKTHFADE